MLVLAFGKLTTNFFQPTAVLAQIRISEARSGADMDKPLFFIHEEFTVIGEEEGVKLNTQILRPRFDKSDIFPEAKGVFQSGEGGVGRIAERQGLYAMRLIQRLT